MKSAPFEYRAPDSIDEVLSLLAAGNGVRVLAGGQSLVPLMKARAREADARRRREPRPRARRHRGAADGSLVIGALDAAAGAARQPGRRGRPAAAPRGRPLRRLPRDAASRHRRWLARLRGSVGRAHGGRRCARCPARDSLGTRRAHGGRALVLPWAARDGARARRAAHRGEDPGCRRADGRRLSRGQRALPGLRPGRSSSDRHARRGGNVHGGRARPPPRCARRRIAWTSPTSSGQRSETPNCGCRGVVVGLEPDDDIEVSGTYRRGASR